MLWRSPESVHLELGDSAVVIEGLPAALIRRVAAPVAPSNPPPPIDDAARHALATLTESGYFWPRASGEADDTRLALFVAPVWFLLLGAAWHFNRKSPLQQARIVEWKAVRSQEEARASA